MTSEHKMRVVTIVTTIATVVVATVIIVARARTAELYSYDWRPVPGMPRACGEPITEPLKFLDCDRTPLNRGNPNSLQLSVDALAQL
jgi:hypothetical protein